MSESLDFGTAMARVKAEGGGRIQLPPGIFEVVGGRLVPYTRHRRLLRLRKRWRAWRHVEPVDPRRPQPVAFTPATGMVIEGAPGGWHTRLRLDEPLRLDQ